MQTNEVKDLMFTLGYVCRHVNDHDKNKLLVQITKPYMEIVTRIE